MFIMFLLLNVYKATSVPRSSTLSVPAETQLFDRRSDQLRTTMTGKFMRPSTLHSHSTEVSEKPSIHRLHGLRATAHSFSILDDDFVDRTVRTPTIHHKLILIGNFACCGLFFTTISSWYSWKAKSLQVLLRLLSCWTSKFSWLVGIALQHSLCCPIERVVFHLRLWGVLRSSMQSHPPIASKWEEVGTCETHREEHQLKQNRFYAQLTCHSKRQFLNMIQHKALQTMRIRQTHEMTCVNCKEKRRSGTGLEFFGNFFCFLRHLAFNLNMLWKKLWLVSL